MPKDWKALKAKRVDKTRQGPIDPPTSSPKEDKQSPQAQKDMTASGDEKAWKRIDYAHEDLPDSLSVREIPAKGRGLVAEQSVTTGSTLLSTVPLVSVLDNYNLRRRCSTCYRTRQDTDDLRPLQQCSRCRVVQYCSNSCQRLDWSLHKFECKALRNMAEEAQKRGHAKCGHFVPDTPIRVIGRVLWRRQIEGDGFWDVMKSLSMPPRGERSPIDQRTLFALFSGLTQYVGQTLMVDTCHEPFELIDLFSRFTSNSFSLTSPADLTNIGVSISPVAALINHSCRPNAVVVFPKFPAGSTSSLATSADKKNMRVVAIRPIKRGEEILTSYVDLASPRDARQADLLERYKFRCECEVCESESVDPREAFQCTRANCPGLLPITDGPAKLKCSQCGTLVKVSGVKAALEAAKSAFEEAERTQYSDPASSYVNVHSGIALLTSFSPRLPPSCHPLFQSYMLLFTLQLYRHEFDAAARTSHEAWAGAKTVYPYGHPVRAVLAATIARLACVPPDRASAEDELEYWSDGGRLSGVNLLIEAVKECEVGFGSEDGGGLVGTELRALIREQEEGMAMSGRVSRAQSGSA